MKTRKTILRESLTNKDIFDILGIEEANRKLPEYRKLLSQFRELAKEHDANKIWLKGDKDVACDGKVVAETDDLIVCEESLNEAPISGSDNLLSYNNEVKNILANVKNYIKENKDAQSVYDLIFENMKEDVRYNVEHWARKGENLNTLVNKYQECIDAFAKAYKKETEKLSKLNSLMNEMKEIIKNTKSTKESLKEEDKEDSKEPKLETFDEQMDFLAKDEQEAIEGYEKVIALVEDEHVKEQLEKILIEEKAHKEFLEKVKGDHSLEYSHAEHEEEKEIVNVEPEDVEVINELEITPAEESLEEAKEPKDEDDNKTIRDNDCDLIALIEYEGGEPIDYTESDKELEDWLNADKKHSWFPVTLDKESLEEDSDFDTQEKTIEKGKEILAKNPKLVKKAVCKGKDGVYRPCEEDFDDDFGFTPIVESEEEDEVKVSWDDLDDDVLDLETAIKFADDDVLDDVLGKDTPERKVAKAIKPNKDIKEEQHKTGHIKLDKPVELKARIEK